MYTATALSFIVVLASSPCLGIDNLEDVLQVGFTDNISAGSIETHNLTVICHTTYGKWEGGDKEDRISLVDLYPFLCTHIVINRFVVEADTHLVKLNPHYDDNESELLAVKTIKDENKWMKLLIMMEHSDFPSGGGVQQRNFMKSLFEAFESKDIDGIYLYLDSVADGSSHVMKEVCRQIREAGFLVVLSIHDVGGGTLTLPPADFITQSTVVYDGGTVRESKHATPYSSMSMDVSKLLSMASNSSSVLLPLDPDAELLVLKEPCEGWQKNSSCCGVGRPVVNNHTWPLRIGHAGLNMYDDNSSFVGLAMWRLYHKSPASWSIWRSDKHKEVYICNGEYWISFQDRESLESMLDMVRLYNLGGVDIKYMKRGDDKNGDCDPSNSPIKSRYPFFLQANQIISKMFPNATRPPPSMKRNPSLNKLQASAEACELARVLETLRIPESERRVWFCMASKESNFTSFRRITQVPSEDSQGCSTTHFGILGLSSPLCKDDRRAETCQAICNTRCIDLMGNALESVKCVLAGLLEPTEFRHRYWTYCESFANETINLEDCAHFSHHNESSGRDYGRIVVLVLVVTCGVILFGFGLVYLWFRLKTRQLLNRRLVVDNGNDPPQALELTNPTGS